MSIGTKHEEDLLPGELHGFLCEEGREKDKNGEEEKAHVKKSLWAVLSLHFFHTLRQCRAHEGLKARK